MPKPDVLARSKARKAQSLCDSGRLGEAKALYDELRHGGRLDAATWLAAAVTSRRLGLYADAEACARRALAVRPDASAYHVLGSAVQCQGRVSEAAQHYRRAIELDPRFADAYYFLGNLLRESGAWEEAVVQYRKTTELRPDFIPALSNLGGALVYLDRHQEGWDVLARAARINPDVPQVLTNQGLVLQQEKHFEQARAKYLRALTVAPGFPDAIGPMADVCEKMGLLEDARMWLDKARSLSLEDPLIELITAKLARRAGNMDDVVSRLELLATRTLSNGLGREAHGLLGQAYDRIGNAERAFEHFLEASRYASQIPAAGGVDKSTRIDRIDRLSTFFVPDLGKSANDTPPGNAPVFIVGFPRSGTTLLDQMLDCHPRLRTIEEKQMAHAMEEAFLKLAGNDVRALAELSAENVVALRRIYFSTAAQFVQREADQILVDRNPMNTFRVPLLWRIFPDAKFVFAARHPCDVCLSCFMQSFELNEVTVHFTSLENTARLYNREVEVWRRCVSELPLHHYAIRYEDLIVDVEQETRGLLEFLGVDWDDAVLRHVEHAKNKPVIRTASYHQVTKPVYQHARYRWQRYRAQLQEVVDILGPHINYFGYAESASEVAEGRIGHADRASR